MSRLHNYTSLDLRCISTKVINLLLVATMLHNRARITEKMFVNYLIGVR